MKLQIPFHLDDGESALKFLLEQNEKMDKETWRKLFSSFENDFTEVCMKFPMSGYFGALGMLSIMAQLGLNEDFSAD